MASGMSGFPPSSTLGAKGNVPVLFLDVDGVLNQCGHHQEVLTEKAGLLARIVSETQCRIVVSSTWRLYEELRDRLTELLQVHAISISDWTPCIDRRTDSGIYIATERGEEIQRWLDENPGTTRFVILDDHADMAHLTAHLLQTESSTGLTEVLVEEAIRRLK
jgi:hypothetical protein